MVSKLVEEADVDRRIDCYLQCESISVGVIVSFGTILEDVIC